MVKRCARPDDEAQFREDLIDKLTAQALEIERLQEQVATLGRLAKAAGAGPDVPHIGQVLIWFMVALATAPEAVKGWLPMATWMMEAAKACPALLQICARIIGEYRCVLPRGAAGEMAMELGLSVRQVQRHIATCREDPFWNRVIVQAWEESSAGTAWPCYPGNLEEAAETLTPAEQHGRRARDYTALVTGRSLREDASG